MSCCWGGVGGGAAVQLRQTETLRPVKCMITRLVGQHLGRDI